MKKTLITIFSSGLLIISLMSAAAEYKPYVGLYSYFGEREITLSANDSFVFTISIENGAARTIRRANQRNQSLLDSYAKTQEYQSLTEEALKRLAKNNPIREIPELSLGSTSVQVTELINLQARNAAGEVVQLNARPLRSSVPKTEAIAVTESRPLEIHYVVDKEDISRLSEGQYSIAVALENKHHEGMWQGWAYSKPIQLNLHSQHPDAGWSSSEKRLQRIATFLILDQQYVEAESVARDWIKQKPETISGWAQLGEALAGQDKNAEALQAFKTAESQFRLKYGNQPAELPEYIIDRISEIEVLIR